MTVSNTIKYSKKKTSKHLHKGKKFFVEYYYMGLKDTLFKVKHGWLLTYNIITVGLDIMSINYRVDL